MKVYNKFGILSSLAWAFLKNSGTMIIQFILQIVMARILMPNDYGIIALVMVFINVAIVITQSGLNSALIQKTNPDNGDYSTVFTSSLMFSIILYIILFITAPFIAKFYSFIDLIYALRLLGLILLIGPFQTVQNAFIAKNALYKKQFYANITSLLLSGSIGLFLAYNGFGIWALISQVLLNAIIQTVVLLFIIKWKPSIFLSKNKFVTMFKFGYKLLIVGVINEIYNDIRTLIIGRNYSSSVLGIYDRGFNIPRTIIKPVDNTIQTIMFPAFSEYKDSIPHLYQIVSRAMKTSIMFIFPLMIGIALVAHPLVIFLLTDKWLGIVPYIQIFALLFAFEPIHSINRQVTVALGKSNLSLLVEIIRKTIGVVILLVSLKYGVIYIAIGSLVDGLIGLSITTYPTYRYLKYSLLKQLFDILPVIVGSIFMAATVFLASFLDFNIFTSLILQGIIGALTYITILIALKYEPLLYVYKLIKEKVGRIN